MLGRSIERQNKEEKTLLTCWNFGGALLRHTWSSMLTNPRMQVDQRTESRSTRESQMLFDMMDYTTGASQHQNRKDAPTVTRTLPKCVRNVQM